MNEEWREIAGWPGYEVSDHGRVRSWWGPARQAGAGQGRRSLRDSPKIVGGYLLKSGHSHAMLYRNASKESRRVSIHTLVLEAFVGPRPKGMFCCHSDGDPSNNHVSNLRWDTPSNNNLDTMKHGGNVTSTLTADVIPDIWNRLLRGESNPSIGRRYSVSAHNISRIRNGHQWSHITSNLPGWPIVTPDPDPKPVFISERFTGGQEVWRDVIGVTGYQVSTHGRVRSRWERVSRKSWGMVDKWHDVNLRPDQDGYIAFSLTTGSCPGRKTRRQTVHVAVLSAFAGPRPNGMLACHIDGDKLNNRAENLRWDTAKSNAIDRVKHGQ